MSPFLRLLLLLVILASCLGLCGYAVHRVRTVLRRDRELRFEVRLWEQEAIAEAFRVAAQAQAQSQAQAQDQDRAQDELRGAADTTATQGPAGSAAGEPAVEAAGGGVIDGTARPKVIWLD